MATKKPPLKKSQGRDLTKFGKSTAANPFGFKAPVPPAKKVPLLERGKSSIPSLSDRVAIARVEAKKGQSAGIASPADLRAESRASALVSAEQGRRSASTAAAVAKTTPAPPSAPKKTPPEKTTPLNPRAGMAAAEAKRPKGQIDIGLPSRAKSALEFAGKLTDPTSFIPKGGTLGDVVGYINTTKRFAFPNPVDLATSIMSGSISKDAAAAARLQQRAQQGLEKLRPSPGALPHTPIKLSDLNPNTPLYAAATKHKGPIYLDEVAKYGTGNLGVAYRKQLIQQAHDKMGWNISDAATWTDADAAARAFNPYRHNVMGFVQNAAVDIGSLAAGANIAPMLASPMIAAAKGDPQPLARTAGQFVDQWRKHLAFVGDRPLLENLYNQPFTTATSNVPVIKGFGVRAGKLAGISKTREVTLPTTGARATIPATQNVLTRPLAKIPDAILARSQPAEARARMAPGERPGPIASGVGRAGRVLERRYAGRDMARMETTARLAKSSEARHAQGEYLRAIRDLPMRLGDLRPSRGKKVAGGAEGADVTHRVSSKQQRAEAIVKHAGIGMSSNRAAVYYDRLAKQSELDARAHSEEAARQREIQREAETQGNADEAALAGDRATRAVTDSTRAARVAEQQHVEAEYSRRNPVDLRNLSPAEQRVAAAGLKVSRATTAMKSERGALGEAGALYGDLQHNMEMTAALEPDSQAGRMARVALAHRENMDALETQMKGGKLADRRSQAASQQLGRVKALRSTLADIQGRRQAVAARRQRAQETLTRRVGAVEPGTPRRGVPERVAAQAESAAQAAGVAPATLRAILNEGRRALTAKARVGAGRLHAEERVLAEMESSQLAAHQRVASSDLRPLQRALQVAQDRTNSPTVAIAKQARADVERLTPQVEMFRQRLERGFQPDDRLVKQRAKVAKMQADTVAPELSNTELSAITSRHVNAAQEKAIGKVLLHDAIHEGQFTGADRELARLEERTQAAHDEASGRYEQISGSKSDAAIRHEEESRAFLTAMQEYQKHQHAQNIDPYHITLHAPETKTGTTATEKSGRQQFTEGNYTHDIHIQISADLEANAQLAVLDDLMRQVSETPYVIHRPDPGSRIGPGFVLTEERALQYPKRPEYGNDGNKDLIDAWEEQARARKSQQYVPDDGKQYVLVAKDAQDWIKNIIGRTRSFDNALLDSALQFTNLYRRWMLFSLPRTLVNNALGNPILAMMGGAGIMDYMRAWSVLRNRRDLAPITQLHAGPIANVLETQKLTGWQSFFRNANVFHEDLGRLTVYMHHAIRYARHEQGLKFYQRVDMASTEMTKLLKDLAEGRDPNVHRFMAFATRWFGDMSKRNKWDPVLSTAFLFHRWVGHMVNLTLWQMPTKFPGRTALLLNLSKMADDYRKEHGLFPEWAKGIVGIFESVDTVAGAPQRVIWGANTSGVNPFATPGQTFDLGTTAQAKMPFASIAAANINPVARIILEQGFGARLDTLQPFKDQYGNPVSPGNWGLLAQQIIANTPILSTVFPRTGLADTSIQIDPNAPRRYSAAGSIDPSYYPPTPLGHGWWYDALLRGLAAAGVSIRPVDSRGPRTELSAQKTVAWQAQQAATRAAKKQRVELGAQLAENRKRWANQPQQP